MSFLIVGSASHQFPLSYRLPDGLTRRGDINLLLLGDPGTAKSQLLKFVEKVAPIGVSLVESTMTISPSFKCCCDIVPYQGLMPAIMLGWYMQVAELIVA